MHLVNDKYFILADSRFELRVVNDIFAYIIYTGVAGGILRDVLLGEIPLVFRREIYLYATAAFGGASGFVLLQRYSDDPKLNAILGTAITLLLRLAGIRWRIRLPMFRPKFSQLAMNPQEK